MEKTKENYLHELLADNNITIHVDIRQKIYAIMQSYSDQQLRPYIDKIAELERENNRLNYVYDLSNKELEITIKEIDDIKT
jgi:hypothetical protein